MGRGLGLGWLDGLGLDGVRQDCRGRSQAGTPAMLLKLPTSIPDRLTPAPSP